jgi:hypothetical protein
MVNDVLTAVRARDNSCVGRRNGKAEGQSEELLELLTRTKHLRDLLTLKSFEVAAIYARVEARNGHAYATSITRMSRDCGLSEAEARNWIRLGEAMLKSVPKSE